MRIKNLLIAVLAVCATQASAQGLTKAEAEAKRGEIIEAWKAQVKEESKPWMSSGVIPQDTLGMRIWAMVYGHAPEGERSLWISLHGGGGAPAEVNDQQWDNQTKLYAPAEGVYVAPRAPFNLWNMWCKEPIDSMYEKLIRMMVCNFGVNPNKVYILGYSAGGDGVWREAPRMADHWAAASMMAGHPGNVRMESLLNLPYMIWCGALDAAYDRNKLDAEMGVKLDSLQKAHPDGYIHQTHIMEGKAHWMDRADTVAISWMAKYTRNPYPKHVIWREEEVTKEDFYWLSVKNPLWGLTIDAQIKGNTITLNRVDDYREVTLWLNDELVNLDKPVTVKYRGKKIFKGKVLRTTEAMQESMQKRQDPSYCFPAKVTVKTR